MTNCAASTKQKITTPVMEDYLEAILELSIEKKLVRVKDIAQRLNVKMPTVTSQLKSLNERGLVKYEKYESVELTDEGRKIGASTLNRHTVLLEFLTKILGVEFDTANVDACKIEHALSEETLQKLTEFLQHKQ